jgi:anthranilate/para-aminobenzoate synthase component I
MKSLKRLYSLIEAENKNDTRLPKLAEFFNSEYGLLNKSANDLAVLLLLTDKHDIPFEKIYANLQYIKEQLALTSVVSKPKILMLNKITKKNYKKIVEKLIDHIRSKINPVAKDFLKKIE